MSAAARKTVLDFLNRRCTCHLVARKMRVGGAIARIADDFDLSDDPAVFLWRSFRGCCRRSAAPSALP